MILQNFKHLLFLSILCSLVLFTNCGEDEEQETTPITTGLSENQDLLIGSWDVVETDQDQIVADLGTIVFSFESDNSVARAETWSDGGVVYTYTYKGYWSFMESDPSRMTVGLFYTESSLTELDSDNPFTSSVSNTTILTIKSISNKRMSAIENQKIDGITLEFTFNIECIKQ